MEDRFDESRVLSRSLCKIDDVIGADFFELSDPFLIPNIPFANLQKSAVIFQDAKTLGDELPTQRIQYDIYTLPAGDLHDLFSEIKRARMHDVLHTEGFEKPALLGTSGSR